MARNVSRNVFWSQGRAKSPRTALRGGLGMGVLTSTFIARQLAVLAVAGLAAAASGGSGITAEAVGAFSPRPQGGISGSLLPPERKLLTYDAGARKYVAATGDASGHYTPNRRKP